MPDANAAGAGGKPVASGNSGFPDVLASFAEGGGPAADALRALNNQHERVLKTDIAALSAEWKSSDTELAQQQVLLARKLKALDERKQSLGRESLASASLTSLHKADSSSLLVRRSSSRNVRLAIPTVASADVQGPHSAPVAATQSLTDLRARVPATADADIGSCGGAQEKQEGEGFPLPPVNAAAAERSQSPASSHPASSHMAPSHTAPWYLKKIAIKTGVSLKVYEELCRQTERAKRPQSAPLKRELSASCVGTEGGGALGMPRPAPLVRSQTFTTSRGGVPLPFQAVDAVDRRHSESNLTSAA